MEEELKGLEYKDFHGYKVYEDGRVLGKFNRFLVIKDNSISLVILGKNIRFNIVKLIQYFTIIFRHFTFNFRHIH